MLRLSKLTDYGTVVMTCLAQADGDVLRANEVADRTRLGGPTVSKLLKALAGGGLLDSFRGAHGGYRLARAASKITVVEIIDALEGPVALTECSETDGACAQAAHCSVRPNWQRINTAIRDALGQMTLADLAAPKRAVAMPARPLRSAGANPGCNS
ncbi:MAG: SUF system Fe-S cluster assembly regulator [Chromatiales bacterium]|nr:SUF system Fe-S cluster assembly regulator [Chromatiales bacterium]